MIATAAILGAILGLILALTRLTVLAAGLLSGVALLCGLYGWYAAGAIHFIEALVLVVVLQGVYLFFTHMLSRD